MYWLNPYAEDVIHPQCAFWGYGFMDSGCTFRKTQSKTWPTDVSIDFNGFPERE